MGLQIYNTLTRQVEPFVPLDPAGKRVGMYCCGPTVYDYAHIGNWRTFVFADLVRRYLEFLGYEVKHVMNITDVEDKIIRRVHETGMTLKEYTGKYEAAFFEDFSTLNCKRPHYTPRATEHIPDIIAHIQKLIEKGVAYQASDGSVYFSIRRYQELGGSYGRLVKLDPGNEKFESRIRADEYAKESAADFALWKAYDPEDGEIYWDSPWGRGRPGWHIECSVMSSKWLGPSFDLHLGGEDLIFPHHENEIAQSEALRLQDGRLPGPGFVKYWLHGAHLLVDGQKMSKSLGNFYTLRDLVAKGFTGREVRFALLGAHYRESLNFTVQGLQAARNALQRLDEVLDKLQVVLSGYKCSVPEEPVSGCGRELVTRFKEAMDDDLNISKAWAGVFEWVREINRMHAMGRLDPTEAANAMAGWKCVNAVLGLPEAHSAEAPPEVLDLIQQRESARKARDFARADQIREQLRTMGWWVEDTPKGPRLKKI